MCAKNVDEITTEVNFKGANALVDLCYFFDILVSISSTLNVQILHTKAFFSSYVLSLTELSYKKHGCKMLMKLTPPG